MPPGQSVIRQEGGRKTLVIDFRGLSYGADIAQYPQAMQLVIDKLMEADVDEVVLAEYYERIYNEEQTRWLKEIAAVISSSRRTPSGRRTTSERRWTARRFPCATTPC